VEGCWLTLISRCLEKTATFTNALLKRTLEFLEEHDWLKGIVSLAIWSDCGPHFKPRKVLANIACVVMKDRRLHAEWNFMPEYHGKGIVDAYFSRLEHSLAETSNREVLAELDDVIATWQDLARCHMAEQRTTTCTDYFENFFPLKKEDYPVHDFRMRSWMVPIQSCYQWSWTLVDSRRQSLWGSGERADQLTGVLQRAHLVSGVRCSASRSCHPLRLVPTAPPEPEEDHDEELEGEDATLQVHTRIFLGWRCSYRTEMAEQVDEPRILRRLSKKSKDLECVRPAMDVAPRVRPLALRVQAAVASAARKQSQSKQWHAAKAEMRADVG
jgi:hypothetical protein